MLQARSRWCSLSPLARAAVSATARARRKAGARVRREPRPARAGAAPEAPGKTRADRPTRVARRPAAPRDRQREARPLLRPAARLAAVERRAAVVQALPVAPAPLSSTPAAPLAMRALRAVR